MKPSSSLRKGLALLTLATCAALVPKVYAHHSFAIFDQTKTVTLQGVVGRFVWSNPHISIYFDAPGPPAQQYKIETGSVNAMSRSGWKADSLKAGDVAEVTFKPLKNGDPGGLLVEIKVGDVVLSGGG